ncbi:DUF5667 domain-containing protein [Nocardioides sp. TF02-7]|uniref:DUF5667 domain-containing protein n=1 Tax=Nocardioides sp. TF02-7 TaxID=2917724 RepID=UPI001F061F1C|nr:DUF5667 domain-containing protein [Nocardioides sp. TF02-7]UMG93860.1 DUF5667 domain-containing protein [Nocardioides sp. TF02-7]
MTGGFVSKRRADEFDALLSTPAAERDEAAAAAYADLLEVVGSLRSAPPVEARPEFVADLRSRLVVAAARQPSTRPVDAATVARLTPRQRRGSRERRLAAVLGGFAVVAASGSMAMASQAALPGDVLYPVKRAIENAQTNVQSSDAERAETLLAHAERRLQEVEELSARGDDANADEIAATLEDFGEHAHQAAELAIDDYTETGEQAGVDRLRTFTGTSMGELDALGDRIPADARPALITAAQTVRNADDAAFNACPTCGDGAVTELPEFAASVTALPSTLLGLETTSDSTVAPAPRLHRPGRGEGRSGRPRRRLVDVGAGHLAPPPPPTRRRSRPSSSRRRSSPATPPTPAAPAHPPPPTTRSR